MTENKTTKTPHPTMDIFRGGTPVIVKKRFFILPLSMQMIGMRWICRSIHHL